MDWNYVALISITAALLLVMIQRTVPNRRRLAAVFVILIGLIIRQNAFIKGDLHEETLIAIVIGIVLSGLFWLLIGRYNPVDAGDDIKVLGMDD